MSSRNTPNFLQAFAVIFSIDGADDPLIAFQDGGFSSILGNGPFDVTLALLEPFSQADTEIIVQTEGTIPAASSVVPDQDAGTIRVVVGPTATAFRISVRTVANVVDTLPPVD